MKDYSGRNQQENDGLEKQSRPNGPNSLSIQQKQNTYILFKYTQNIPEDISYDAAQNKSANLRKLKSYQIYFQTMIYETRNQQEEKAQKIYKYVGN